MASWATYLCMGGSLVFYLDRIQVDPISVHADNL